jgi:hypothetical protein
MLSSARKSQKPSGGGSVGGRNRARLLVKTSPSSSNPAGNISSYMIDRILSTRQSIIPQTTFMIFKREGGIYTFYHTLILARFFVLGAKDLMGLAFVYSQTNGIGYVSTNVAFEDHVVEGMCDC